MINQKTTTNLFLGSLLVLITLIDVFTNSFFNLNLTSFFDIQLKFTGVPQKLRKYCKNQINITRLGWLLGSHLALKVQT